MTFSQSWQGLSQRPAWSWNARDENRIFIPARSLFALTRPDLHRLVWLPHKLHLDAGGGWNTARLITWNTDSLKQLSRWAGLGLWTSGMKVMAVFTLQKYVDTLSSCSIKSWWRTASSNVDHFKQIPVQWLSGLVEPTCVNLRESSHSNSFILCPRDLSDISGPPAHEEGLFVKPSPEDSLAVTGVAALTFLWGLTSH